MTNSSFATTSYAGDFSGLSQHSCEKPAAKGRDILVRVHAVSTNPVDCKALVNFGQPGQLAKPKIVGWDASGVVECVGDQAKCFKAGNEVYFAGSLIRDGCFADYVLVDERLVALKPKKLSHLEAAALPLTTLTAWEMFELRMQLPRNSKGKNILIVGGAGGVGSIATQIAKKVFGLTVIATASRPETVEWCKKLGADFVINHCEPLAPQLEKIGFKQVDAVFNTADLTQKNLQEFSDVAKVSAPIGFITAKGDINPMTFYGKCQRLVAELMFAAPIQGINMEGQGKILKEMAELVDSGVIKTTLNATFPWSLQGLKDALNHQGSGKAIGKVGLQVLK